MSVVNSSPEKMNLSFSGCGFLCIYHCGVAAAIKEYAPHLTQTKVSGASAGSIIAAGLVCDVCISQATSIILQVVLQARSRTAGPMNPSFDLMGVVREELYRVLPPDAYRKCNKRVHISLTRWSDHRNVIVNTYESNKDLIDAIVCSCFIPFYGGLSPPFYKGEQYIDGGFSDNQPAVDEHTVTVSPFSGESDICPPDWDSASFLGIDFKNTSLRFTTRNLFRLTACLMPASLEDCSKMCLQGFEDALRFLTKNGMAPCIRCMTIETDVIQDTSPDVLSPIRALSPQIRSRNRSASNLLGSGITRRRAESECDTCCESEHMYNTRIADIFPRVLLKKFEEAAAAERSLFDYLFSFRIFRYTRTALGLTKLPFDFMLIIAKNLTMWMSSVVVPEWLRLKLSSLVDFIYQEIDYQRSRYNARFSCQVPLIDDAPCSGSQKPYYMEGVELSEQAKQERAFLAAKDRGIKLPRQDAEMSPKAQPRISHEWSYMDEMDSVDSVVEYTKKHDSMYEFHYRDEKNMVHTIGIFNMDKPERRHKCQGGVACCSASAVSAVNGRQTTTGRPVSVVVEEEEEAVLAAAAAALKRDEDDSGLSVDERSGRTRDACCSPVREFAPLGGGTAGGSGRSSFRSARSTPQQTRRAATTTGGASSSAASPNLSHHSSHSHTQPVIRKSSHVGSGSSAAGRAMLSSDSEAESGEKFFVPRGRHRTSSKEYDGEPEQSDTDHAN